MIVGNGEKLVISSTNKGDIIVCKSYNVKEQSIMMFHNNVEITLSISVSPDDFKLVSNNVSMEDMKSIAFDIPDYIPEEQFDEYIGVSK